MYKIIDTDLRHVPKKWLDKFGSTDNVDTATNTDVWAGANNGIATALWVPPTEARVHAIVSGSTADNGDPAGTGAHSIFIQGLDENWDEISETVVLNGQSSVNTANAYIRINRMYCVAAGSGGVNAGDITATAATDSTIYAVILAGKGQTEQAIYSVPRNHYLYIKNYAYAMRRNNPSNSNANILLYVRNNADTATSCWRLQNRIGAYIDSSAQGGASFAKPGLRVDGKSDVRISVEGCSDDNTGFSAWFNGYVVTQDAV